MKRLFFAFVLTSFLLNANSQEIKRHKIALVAPLYLDSAFDYSGQYRFDKTFPKFLNPGVEFYLGAQAALDSLNRAGAPLEVYVIDSRSATDNLLNQINGPLLSDLEMIIANASPSELRLLAEETQNKKIPLISATLPNDAGISANPYVVVLNSTLRSHAEGVYRYLQKYHSLDKIKVFTKTGTQETQLKENLQEAGRSARSVALQMDFVDIGTNFTAAGLIEGLDSNSRNVIVAGSLDLAFATRLLQQLATVSRTYPITVIGMPTWENINLAKNDYKQLEIVYSTPFNYAQPNSLATKLGNEFNAKQGAKAGELFYRGYETMLRFSLLLLDSSTDVASSLARKGNNIFTNFDIQPVFLDRSNLSIDYYENRNLYFIRYQNGVKSIR
jgi:hypothetical protein